MCSVGYVRAVKMLTGGQNKTLIWDGMCRSPGETRKRDGADVMMIDSKGNKEHTMYNVRQDDKGSLRC